jgi:hypothetical protein
MSHEDYTMSKMTGLQLLGAAIKAPFVTAGVAADVSIRSVNALHKGADSVVDGIELAVHTLNMGMINAHIACNRMMKDQGYNPDLSYHQNLQNMEAMMNKPLVLAPKPKS